MKFFFPSNSTRDTSIIQLQCLHPKQKSLMKSSKTIQNANIRQSPESEMQLQVEFLDDPNKASDLSQTILQNNRRQEVVERSILENEFEV